MKRDILYATGFFEIGDTFYDEQGHLHTVTDVLVCHYIRRGIYKVKYEVDGSGEFIDLVMKGFGDFPDQPTKPNLHLIGEEKTSRKPSGGGE